MKTRVNWITIILAILPNLCFADSFIGVAWIGKSKMADRVYLGLESQLKIRAPQIKIDLQKELKDTKELEEIINRFKNEKNAMVILRSSGAKLLANRTPGIPTFIGGTEDPLFLGTVDNLENPSTNITGVTYSVNPISQLSGLTKLIGKIDTALLIVDKRYKSAKYDIEQSTIAAASLKISLTIEEVDSTEKAIDIASNNFSKYSVIILGNQSTLTKATYKIIQASSKTPVFSYSPKAVKYGAVLGFMADDLKLGKALADTIIDVMIKNKPINQVGVKFDLKPKSYLNLKSALHLGLEIPQNILEEAVLIEDIDKS